MILKIDTLNSAELIERAAALHARRARMAGQPAIPHSTSQCEVLLYPDRALVVLRSAHGLLGSFVWNGRRMIQVDEAALDAAAGADPVRLAARHALKRTADWYLIDEMAEPERYESATRAVHAADDRTVATPATTLEGVIEKLSILASEDLAEKPGLSPVGIILWEAMCDLHRMVHAERRDMVA